MRDKDTDGNVTFEYKLFFKACRIAEGDLELLPIFTSPVTVPPMIVSDVGSLRGKSFAKLLSRSIAPSNVLFRLFALDVVSMQNLNASSTAIKTLFSSQWNGIVQVTEKYITFLAGRWKECSVRGLGRKIGIKRLGS